MIFFLTLWNKELWEKIINCGLNKWGMQQNVAAWGALVGCLQTVTILPEGLQPSAEKRFPISGLEHACSFVNLQRSFQCPITSRPTYLLRCSGGSKGGWRCLCRHKQEPGLQWTWIEVRKSCLAQHWAAAANWAESFSGTLKHPWEGQTTGTWPLHTCEFAGGR